MKYPRLEARIHQKLLLGREHSEKLGEPQLFVARQLLL